MVEGFFCGVWNGKGRVGWEKKTISLGKRLYKIDKDKFNRGYFSIKIVNKLNSR
jgi:hypothetical protein